MSLGVPALRTQAVLEPRLNIQSERHYNILRGGKNISFKPVTSTSYSNSQIQITAPPPNPAIIVDRELYLLLSARLNITTSITTNNATGNVIPAKSVLIGYNDALRAYPISNGIIQTLQATLNNTSVSVNMSDVIEPMLRYNVPEFKRGKIFSMSPSMQDQFQLYSDWVNAPVDGIAGGARHPLANYGAISGDEMARGGFSSMIITNNAFNVPTGNNTTTNVATVDVLLCEPIFLSPFLFGGEGAGFIGIQTMDFNFTLANLPRMWSNYSQTVNASALAITGIDVTIGGGAYSQAPTLLFNYITPGELMPIHREYVYPYYNIDRYPTPEFTLAADASLTVSSNNVQLQSIPRRIYLLARESNAQRTNGAKQWTTSDVYASIEQLTVNWNNNAGLLSSAKKQDLYRMAVNNGCQMSWNQFDEYTGSVLALDFGKDIQLGDLEAPGKLMTSQLQIDCRFKNTSSEQRTYTFYIIVVSEGTFTIVDNRCITQIGVVSENDIFDASKSAERQPYMHVENIYGGDFFSGLKHLIKDGYSVAKDVAPAVLPIIKSLSGMGMSGGEVSGSGFSGGKMVSRDALKQRINKALKK